MTPIHLRFTDHKNRNYYVVVPGDALIILKSETGDDYAYILQIGHHTWYLLESQHQRLCFTLDQLNRESKTNNKE